MRPFAQAVRAWPILRLSLGLTLAPFAVTAACSSEPKTASKPLVTDVAHSQVKNQSIGNCWLYAAAAWAESLHLAATGEEVDLSESYWTWWHFYDQMVGNANITALQTGGWWGTSNGLISKHGYLLEGEFIEEEASISRSARQQAATSYINQQLQTGGALATAASRTPENVRAQLDLAFGTDMASAEAMARPASGLVVGKKPNGSPISLLDVAGGDQALAWRQYNYPVVTGQTTPIAPITHASRKALLKRVMKALNDRQPVVMTLMIDFNAWDKPTGTFDLSTLEAATQTGQQGGHMLVLEDYAVDNVPGVGSIEEGDVSDELKAKALEGDLRHLVVKNSWSTGVTNGYHRFTRGYLDAQLGWKNANGALDYYTTLGSFILPPGY